MSYHKKIMNIRCDAQSVLYREGHRDARHDAAALALEADNTIAELLEALEDVLDGVGFLSGGDHELEGLGITEERGREIRNILKKARGE